MKYVLLTALAGGLIAAPALAQDWVLDREASSVEFEARNSGAALTGQFEDFEADITLDPEDLPGARIDARVSTPSLDGISDSSIRSALRGGGGLGVEAHPDARFVSDEIVATETGYEARGPLTLKGQSHDASLPLQAGHSRWPGRRAGRAGNRPHPLRCRIELGHRGRLRHRTAAHRGGCG